MAFTLSGRYVTPAGANQLHAVSCSGNLTLVPSSFPGSFSVGILYPTEEAAMAAWREATALMCWGMAKSCQDPGSTLGKYLTKEDCLRAMRGVAHSATREGHYQAHEKVWQFASNSDIQWAATNPTEFINYFKESGA